MDIDVRGKGFMAYIFVVETPSLSCNGFREQNSRAETSKDGRFTKKEWKNGQASWKGMTRAVYNLAKKYNYSDTVKPQLSGLFLEIFLLQCMRTCFCGIICNKYLFVPFANCDNFCY